MNTGWDATISTSECYKILNKTTLRGFVRVLAGQDNYAKNKRTRDRREKERKRETVGVWPLATCCVSSLRVGATWRQSGAREQRDGHTMIGAISGEWVNTRRSVWHTMFRAREWTAEHLRAQLNRWGAEAAPVSGWIEQRHRMRGRTEAGAVRVQCTYSGGVVKSEAKRSEVKWSDRLASVPCGGQKYW